MRKFLMAFIMSVASVNAFCAGPHYNCQLQSNSGNVTKTLKFSGGNLVCGHMGIDGCKDGAYVSFGQVLQRVNHPIFRFTIVMQVG